MWVINQSFKRNLQSRKSFSYTSFKLVLQQPFHGCVRKQMKNFSDDEKFFLWNFCKKTSFSYFWLFISSARLKPGLKYLIGRIFSSKSNLLSESCLNIAEQIIDAILW